MKKIRPWEASIAIFILAFTQPIFAFDSKLPLREASAYLEQGMYLEAIGAYQLVVDLSPEPESKALAASRIAGIYAHFLKDQRRALEALNEIIERFPQSREAPRATFNSGLLLYELGRLREAKDRLQTYLARYPEGEERDAAAFLLDAASEAGVTEKGREPAAPIPDDNIRVLLAANLPQVQIASPDYLTVADGFLGDVPAMRTISLEVREGKIFWRGRDTGAKQVQVLPGPRGTLDVNGQLYRGSITVRIGSQGLEVINVLPVEDYLYGVVPQEMPSRWPLEALKAQAVAARSYAYYLRSVNKGMPYNVCATVMTQVYGGLSKETESATRAVNETRGQALFVNSEPALVYYHAHSGGITEDPKNIWSVELPYLKSMNDPYSLKAPSSAWGITLDYEAIRQALNRGGYDLGPISSLEILSTSPSGRVTRIRVTHRGGEVVMTGNEFRLKVGPRQVRSTLFSLIADGQSLRLEGRGYGHGVGMSQWGAQVMAAEGFSYREILKYYYPGTEIR